MTARYGYANNPFDDYENYDELGGLSSTGGFTPQTNGPQYGGLEYQNSPAPRMGGSTGTGDNKKAGGGIPWLDIGLKFASSALSYLGGGYGRGVRKQGVQGLRGMIGKPVYDPNAAFGFARRGTYNDAQQMGGQYDQRFGLDTGRGAGMYGKAIVDRLASQSSGLYVDSEKAKADRDERIYQLLASYQG